MGNLTIPTAIIRELGEQSEKPLYKVKKTEKYGRINGCSSSPAGFTAR
jgi:hypothetical protein